MFWQGGFCPGVYVRGFFVWGFFVLIPFLLSYSNKHFVANIFQILLKHMCMVLGMIVLYRCKSIPNLMLVFQQGCHELQRMDLEECVLVSSH